MSKIFIISMLLIVILIGVQTIFESNLTADNNILAFCCNLNFPQNVPGQSKDADAGMLCGYDHYTIDCETCVRYYSAFLNYGETDSQEMCQYLPGTPPLPDVPVPSDFNVYVNDDDHPVIEWAHYYVHEYRIERKIGSDSWTNIATITDNSEESYIDETITIPDPKGRTIYYKMRGKVYNTYSDYTEEKIPVVNQQRMLPKKLVDDNSDAEPLSQKFALLANYPNPFNSTTAIRFQLPYEAYITFKIYNIRGEDIRSLVNGKMMPGMQQVEWDGTDYSGRTVSSGIYIYQLIAGDYKHARKMTLSY